MKMETQTFSILSQHMMDEIAADNNEPQALQNLRDLLNIHKSKLHSIQEDRDLSTLGKSKALAALNDSTRKDLHKKALLLRKQAVIEALRVNSLRGASWAMGQIASEKMDWARLNYEATAVRSAMALAGADNPYKVEQIWKQIKDTRDPYKIRAFLDTAPAMFPEDSMQASVWDELKASLAGADSLIQTEEQAGYETEAHEHLDKLAEIAAVVQAADNLDIGAVAPGQIMARVFEGINFNTAKGTLKTDFERMPEKQEPGMPKTDKLEDPVKTYERIEAERGERAAAQSEMFQKFGMAYDLDLDGVG
jgi:hypothetical protein